MKENKNKLYERKTRRYIRRWRKRGKKGKETGEEKKKCEVLAHVTKKEKGKRMKKK